MPRYYFDVHDGKDYPDEEGVECADLAEARQQAIRASGEMLRDAADLWTGERWTMTVRDQQGEIVAFLNFSAGRKPALV